MNRRWFGQASDSMNQVSKIDQLLNDFLDGGGEADAAVSQLASLAEEDPILAERIRRELEFSEMIRQVLQNSDDREEVDIFAAIESEKLTLDELFCRVRDGNATPRECDRLVIHLWENPEQSRCLRQLLFEDERLRQAVSASETEEAFFEGLETRMWAEARGDHFVKDFESRLEEEPSAQRDDTGNVVEFSKCHRERRRRMMPSVQIVALAAVVALVAIGTFMAVSQFGVGKKLRGAVVAEVLKSSDDVVWMNDSTPMKNGKIRPGRYELARGVVSLRFPNGQEMTVQGPAKFDVTSDSAAFVHSGIALAKSPANDTGFTLKSNGINFSESAKLIGIDARSSTSTNALVFGGDVGVCLSDGAKCREIYEFEAVKADHKRDKLVDIPYDPHAFEKAWELSSGVEKNLGPVRIEMPGAKIQPPEGVATGTVQVFVESESFHPEKGINVDQVAPGQFASLDTNPGQALQAKGDLRSYLLQLWPDANLSASADGQEEVEASLTFDHPVVGLIFTSDRLKASDALVRTSVHDAGEKDIGEPRNRGLDSGGDAIILSKNRRTINIRLKGSPKDLDQVRVLVALN